MAPQVPRILINDKSFQVAAVMNSREESQTYKPKWHFTSEEIEEHSPSRKDGISHELESYLRQLCCSYLQDLGMELKVCLFVAKIFSWSYVLKSRRRHLVSNQGLEYWTPGLHFLITNHHVSHLMLNVMKLLLYKTKVNQVATVVAFGKRPQVTIATAMILCHRFYMNQSHAKNHWQAVANASMFLACKADNTPRWLRDLIVVAYKLMYRWDPSAPQRIRQKEVYDKQKNLILVAERLILATVGFDLNIQLPYKPLVAALNSMEISQKEMAKVAWNFVNDWLRTTLCLQYKPHYIAAGSIFLAAKLQKIKLPSSNGKAWWMQFDVSPKQLEEVIQHMLQLLGHSRKRACPFTCDPETKIEPISRKRKSESSESCISNESTVQDSRNSTKAAVLSTSAVVKSNRKQQDVDSNDNVNRTENCIMNDSGCTNSVVEDDDGEVITEDLYQKSGCKIVSVKGSQKLDVAGLRERLKRRKSNKLETKKSRSGVDEEINSEAWIERELENGIESVFTL